MWFVRRCSGISLALAGAAAVGCAAPEGSPEIEALAGGRGYWPPNSRTAVVGASEQGVDTVQLDLAVTSDRVLVVSYAWLDPSACTHEDGAPLEEPVVLESTAWADLAELRCGGLPDLRFPNTELVAAPPFRFDTFLEVLEDLDAGMGVNLTFEGASEIPDDELAALALDAWWAADRPNPLYVSSSYPWVLQALEDHARLQARDLRSARIANGMVAALPGGGPAGAAGFTDLLSFADEADADGVIVPWETLDLAQARAARELGYTVGLFPVDDPVLLAELATWPVDSVLTSFPGDAP